MSLAGVVGWIVARGPSKVELPSRDAIYDQPVDEAITLLRDSGLEVGNSKDIGCSVTVEPGYVRQVTVGSEKNVHVLYGKSTDTIDEDASASLQTETRSLSGLRQARVDD